MVRSRSPSSARAAKAGTSSATALRRAAMSSFTVISIAGRTAAEPIIV
jgi:hypothetical protein